MSFVSDAWKDITGRTERDAIKDATRQGIDYGNQANDVLYGAQDSNRDLLNPYMSYGQQSLDQLSAFQDPQAQFDWLQNNPLFQMGLDNANDVTSKMGAATGRLSAGDTLMQLNNNALLTASPLIQGHVNNLNQGANMGFNGVANLMNGNNALAGGISNNLMGMGGFQSEGTLAGGRAQANVTNSTINALGNLFGGMF